MLACIFLLHPSFFDSLAGQNHYIITSSIGIIPPNLYSGLFWAIGVMGSGPRAASCACTPPTLSSSGIP